MNYTEHYNRLIDRGKNRKIPGYTENHHIIPKCLGGNDDKSNLVRLTAREHFIAHILLVKIYPKEYGLIKAVNMLCRESLGQKRVITNRMYGWLKERFAKAMSLSQQGNRNSQYGTMWISNIELKYSKKIYNTNLPKGWVKGRNSWKNSSSRLEENYLEKQIKKIIQVTSRLSDKSYKEGLKMLKLVEYIKKGGNLPSKTFLVKKFNLRPRYVLHALKYTNRTYDEKRGGARNRYNNLT